MTTIFSTCENYVFLHVQVCEAFFIYVFSAYLLGHAWVDQLVQVVLVGIVHQEHVMDNLFLKQWLGVKFLLGPTTHNLVNEPLTTQSKMISLAKWSSFRLQTERLWVRIPMPPFKFQ